MSGRLEAKASGKRVKEDQIILWRDTTEEAGRFAVMQIKLFLDEFDEFQGFNLLFTVGR